MSCSHANAVPVDLLKTGERVAWWCEACETQLPAEFEPPRPAACARCARPVLDFGRLEPDGKTPHSCGPPDCAVCPSCGGTPAKIGEYRRETWNRFGDVWVCSPCSAAHLRNMSVADYARSGITQQFMAQRGIFSW